MRRALAFSITLFLGSAAPLAAQGETPAPSVGAISAAEAITKLQTLIEQPAPAGLNQPDLAAYQAHTEWLRGVVARLVAPRDAATGQASGKRQHTPVTVTTDVVSPPDAATGQATGKRQHKPFAVSIEYETLKRAVEEESLKFTMLSNVLKSRHDMAMSSIRNLK